MIISRMLNRIVSLSAKRLCDFRGKRFVDAIERGLDTFHRKLNNVNFEMAQNGELCVLKKMAKFHPQCVFDVGANNGDWCLIAAKLFSACTIHAFEIVPSTYEELIKNIKGLSTVMPNNFGLSSEEGDVSISIGNDTSTATGCKIEGMKFHNEYYGRNLQCKTRKASDYLNERAIRNIDFLKIDVEGMEFKVIKGFGDQIKNVRVVQFEYGIFNIASHDLLSDFCNYFENNGFIVGKIFPKVVKFFDYHFDMENFHGSNYLAVRRDEIELINEFKQFGI